MRGKPSIQVTCSCLQSTCEHRSIAQWVSWRSEHGGIGQREHQSSGFSLGQATSGRWAPAGLCGGHFHHAQIRSGCWAPQLPLGLRESRRNPQRYHRGAGGYLFILERHIIQKFTLWIFFPLHHWVLSNTQNYLFLKRLFISNNSFIFIDSGRFLSGSDTSYLL